MLAFFESLLEQDTAPVVICDLSHTIRYMNPEAIAHYARFGGAALLGRSVLDCHNPHSRAAIAGILAWFSEDAAHNRVHTAFLAGENTDLYVIALRDKAGKLIGYYEKHENRTRDESPFYQM